MALRCPQWLRLSDKDLNSLHVSSLAFATVVCYSIAQVAQVTPFKHVTAAQECTFRKVWEDDGNVQKVEVEQSATAFFKTIHTRMHVVQVVLSIFIIFSCPECSARSHACQNVLHRRMLSAHHL
jgi:hypothetical protein